MGDLSGMKHVVIFLAGMFLICIVGGYPVFAATTEIHVVKLAADGYTVLSEASVTYQWMEQHLPVRGDGTTHYYLQGPVFVDNPDERWNPAEDTNVQEKDMGAVKGTDIKDLCDLAGGMSPGDTLTVKASDGFSRDFAYENIYEPSSRQGPVILAWYNAEYGYVPSYQDGMRLLFLSDTSTNPWGIHAMGAWDWHESAVEEYWYYYYNGNERYPTTTGLSVRSVNELIINSDEEPAGSIRVVSDPAGALVFLDYASTGQFTPFTLPDLYPGPYLVSVELEGYEIPPEEAIEVRHGLVSDAEFTLEKIPDSPVTGINSGSDSDGTDGTGESGAGTMSLALAGITKGDVILTAIPGLSGPLHGLEERTFGPLPVNFTDRNKPVRLCIFSSGGINPAKPGGVVPKFALSLDDMALDPAVTYTDYPENLSMGLVSTSCWNLSGHDIGPGTLFTLRMENDRSMSCEVRGGILVVLSPGDEEKTIAYWVFEGADATAGISGKDDQGSETIFEFSPDLPATPVSDTHLVVISSGDFAGSLPQYLVSVNAETMSGEYERQDGQVLKAAMNFSPLMPGLAVRTSMQPFLPEKDNSYGENRIVLFYSAIESEKTRVQPVNQTGNLTFPDTLPAAETYLAADQTPGSETTGNTPAEPVPDGQIRVTRPTTFLDRVIDTVASFIFVITGAPPITYEHVTTPDTRPDNNSPAIPLIDRPDENVSVPGLTEYGHSEMASPAVVRMDSEQNGEIQVKNSPADIHRYGGLYIVSHPSDVSLTIDNKDPGLQPPYVINGIRSGSHLIRASMNSAGGKSESRSQRVWVYPGAVMPVYIDLISVEDRTETEVRSENDDIVTFTVDGYYPLRRTPAEVETTGIGSFITALVDGAYISISPSPAYSGKSTIVVPAEKPGFYILPITSIPPGADIFVDGLQTGTSTPARIPNLSAGLHRVTVTLPGYLPGELIVEIPVSGSEVVKTPVQFILESYGSGPLVVDSIPQGAAVLIDGLASGEKTPVTLRNIPIGIHEVTMTLDGETRAGDVIIRPVEGGRCVIRFV
jgi:hypothetical protein